MTWILPKQLHTLACAQDTMALDLDSEQFSQICEKSLMWRSKPSQSRTWLQRWKRESWMQHLSTRTLKPSHTQTFVDAWTFLAADSRASHSALRESVKRLKTQDTFSPILPKESQNVGQQLSFSKMSREFSVAERETENQFCNMSCERWKAWVTAQRQEYSARLKLEQATRENECSSLAWPTPTARDYKGSNAPEGLTRKDGKSRMDSLPNVAQYQSQGQDSSNTHMKSRELNPSWVEQLMGLPIGWTDCDY
jgi:hypothetical protein